ncbi:helix-turn-helix domain-containing protein [Aquabacterium sp. UBA2148]|uniref:helix-turn-helix domain-containing protein n=1 Tax=Aquabacterium sp. UBA2148 TaxID=1946042 RepID=UPI0039C8B268
MSTLDLLATRLPAVVDLRTAARETGFAEQTIRNSLHQGKCPFRGYKDGNRWKFRLQDLADYIDSRCVDEESGGRRGPGKLGRPTKKEQIERRRAAQAMAHQRQGGEQ